MILRKPLVMTLTGQTPAPANLKLGSPLARVQLGRGIVLGSLAVRWPEIVIPHIICEDVATLAFNITDKLGLDRASVSVVVVVVVLFSLTGSERSRVLQELTARVLTYSSVVLIRERYLKSRKLI